MDKIKREIVTLHGGPEWLDGSEALVDPESGCVLITDLITLEDVKLHTYRRDDADGKWKWDGEAD